MPWINFKTRKQNLGRISKLKSLTNLKKWQLLSKSHAERWKRRKIDLIKSNVHFKKGWLTTRGRNSDLAHSKSPLMKGKPESDRRA